MSEKNDDETTATALAPDTAPPPPEEDAQPETFPVDFEEWAATQPSFRVIGVAGFRSVVRKRGDLLRKQQATVWEQGFTAFMGGSRGEE